MYGLATRYQLLLGETNEITKQLYDISWTSGDAKDIVTTALRKWGDFDVNDNDIATGINACKSYLNSVLRGLDKELTANTGWAVGQGLLSGVNSLFDTGLNVFASALTGVVSDLYVDKANSTKALMNEVKRILNTY